MPKYFKDITPLQRESDALRHDLRTHISAIISLAEMIKKKPEASNSSHLLDALQLAAGNALAIMDGNIHQNQSLANETINILDLLEDFELLARGLIQSSGAKLIFQVNENLRANPNCRTDQIQLHRVLMVLLDNAFRYAPGSDLTLSAKRNDTKTITLTLCDCGTGFEEKDPELLFMPYHRGNKHKAIQGTGLGLWSARNILHLLGGSITARANKPQGACFEINLPDTPPKLSPDIKTTSREPDHLEKGKILIVDDNKTNHLILGEMLKSLDFDPTHCLSGQQALDHLQQVSFDLALIDIRMTDMDGWELARQIRKNRANKDMPLIALSSDNRPSKLNHFVLWLERPIRPHDLMKALDLIESKTTAQR